MLIKEGKQDDHKLRQRTGRLSRHLEVFYPLLKERRISTEAKVLVYKTILRTISLVGHNFGQLTSAEHQSTSCRDEGILNHLKGIVKRRNE